MFRLPHAMVTHLALAVICGAPRATLAQDTATLTAMDYIEIQQLVNKLNFALDYCTNRGQDFADLFTEDGEYVIDYGNDDVRVVETREDLVRLAGGPDCESRKTPPSPNVLHLAESLVIEPSSNGARGKSYAIYPSNKGKYFAEDVAGHYGFYHDEYVRTPNGWRLRSRRHEISPQPG